MTLDALPDEILLKIMGYLDGENCHNMSSMNKNFYNLYYNNFDIINKYIISTIIVEENLKNFLVTTSYVRRASRLNKYCTSKFNLENECTFRNLMKHVAYSNLDVFKILLNGNGEFFFDKLSPIDLSRLNGINLKLIIKTLERPNKLLNFLSSCQLSFNNISIEKYGLNEVGKIKDEFYVDIGLGCSDMDLFTNTIKFHELNIIYRNISDSLFSNLYPALLIGRFGVTFTCVEQMFQHRKAMHFKDYETATQIMDCTYPTKIIEMGKLARNYIDAKWNVVRENIMMEALKIKFKMSPFKEAIINYPIRNDGEIRTFLEGSGNKFWGTTIRTSGGLFGTEKIQVCGIKNVMGKMMDSIRENIVFKKKKKSHNNN
uniref:F-box domain-containing protein n=1 Tax=Parastrongyloides trichosuri TaxID=131310 RepID=A0A0N4ZTX1_PARTI